MKLHNAFPTRHGRMTVKPARLVALATTSVVVLLPHGAAAQQTEWSKLPRMQLERQFAGPLQDTVVQRWRDPADGTICYLYLPISAPHSPPTPSGYVQYGSATIGSISCMPGPPAPAAQKR
ncbi:hypothetical protein IP86_12540 [Rhodopseudomonas sp. AAP120]|uniref:hypothetical protein n=1 Tax=Rhodopseudomonas sp. AAP120 TaxID=1523430 RepID=UPI0006B9D187|nr:hypothetical protein [Rhodopseudomonas sp. AAP120]KPF98104.1 hypothetical protein IP86_12540 [Rhodopseudomonas sp. AAP120]